MKEEDVKRLQKEEKNDLQSKKSDKEIETKEKSQLSTKKKENIITSNLGEIKIAPEVLATIVSRIVVGIPGVAGLVSHSKSGFGTLLGAKEMEEGIKIDLSEEKHMSAYISVIIEYGFVIINVAKEIQQVLKNEIESNAGLIVKSINVNIMGIQLTRKNTKVNIAPA